MKKNQIVSLTEGFTAYLQLTEKIYEHLSRSLQSPLSCTFFRVKVCLGRMLCRHPIKIQDTAVGIRENVSPCEGCDCTNDNWLNKEAGKGTSPTQGKAISLAQHIVNIGCKLGGDSKVLLALSYFIL